MGHSKDIQPRYLWINRSSAVPPISSFLAENCSTMLVKTILIFGLIFGLVCGKAVFVQESNIWQLDEDSFWRMALRLETHVIIELYSWQLSQPPDISNVQTLNNLSTPMMLNNICQIHLLYNETHFTMILNNGKSIFHIIVLLFLLALFRIALRIFDGLQN